MPTDPRPSYRFAIFDLDGTLADTLPLIYLAFNDALQPILNRTLGDAEIRGLFGPPDTEILRSLASDSEAEEAIERYMDRYRRDHGDFVRLYEGIGCLFEDAREQGMNDEERSKSILGRIPANRWGQPEDFKGPVVFLASSAADYVHGTILTVDGGWMGR